MNWVAYFLFIVGTLQVTTANNDCGSNCNKASSKFSIDVSKTKIDSFQDFSKATKDLCPLLHDYKTCATNCAGFKMQTFQDVSVLCEVHLFMKTNEKIGHGDCLLSKEKDMNQCLYKFMPVDGKEGDYSEYEDGEGLEEEEEEMATKRKSCCYKMARLQCYSKHLPEKCHQEAMKYNFSEPLYEWKICQSMSCDGITDSEGHPLAIKGVLPNMDNFSIPTKMTDSVSPGGSNPQAAESSSSVSPDDDHVKGDASVLSTLSSSALLLLTLTLLRLY